MASGTAAGAYGRWVAESAEGMRVLMTFGTLIDGFTLAAWFFGIAVFVQKFVLAVTKACSPP